ncbi:MAG: hypothetical protein RLZZ502_1233 [Pseudomonadota bacterium]|jgi:16S rRNA (cytidine1402-2'-O)-methyltransferase
MRLFMSLFTPINALYVVATPIGHPLDITLRALQVLKGVDVVAAEDTRVTAALLKYHGISASLVSIREHNEKAGAQWLIEALSQGKSVAYVSDAGTPAISDPGAVLVAAAHQAKRQVVPVPGASALTAALSVCGWQGEPHFMGFLAPKGRERLDLLRRIKHNVAISIIYEAPHRILGTLDDLAEACGVQRPMCLAKELTKTHETLVLGTVVEIQAYFAADSKRQQGEFVLLIAPAPASDVNLAGAETMMQVLLTELPRAKAAKLTAKLTGISKEVAYELAL